MVHTMVCSIFIWPLYAQQNIFYIYSVFIRDFLSTMKNGVRSCQRACTLFKFNPLLIKMHTQNVLLCVHCNLYLWMVLKMVPHVVPNQHNSTRDRADTKPNNDFFFACLLSNCIWRPKKNLCTALILFSCEIPI